MLKLLCILVNLTRSYKRKHKGMFFSEHSVERMQLHKRVRFWEKTVRSDKNAVD